MFYGTVLKRYFQFVSWFTVGGGKWTRKLVGHKKRRRPVAVAAVAENGIILSGL